MANVIKIKRGSGTPSTSNTEAYELAYDYTADILYIHDGASNTMVPVGTGTVDTSGTPIASEYARFTDANTIQGISAAGVRTDLGLVVGTNVQAQNDYLQDIADLSTSNPTQDGYVLAYNDDEPGFELVEQSGGISFNGSTTNGLLTYGNSTTADVESNLTFDGSHLSIAPTGRIYLDGGSDTYITETSADLVDMYVGAEHALRIADFGNTPYVYVPDNAYLGAGSGIDFSIRHDETNTYITNSTGDMNFVERDAGNINFRNNSGTSHLYIKTGGNVGIGTQSPASKLDLGGSTSGQRITFSNTGVNVTNGARTQAEIGYKTGSYSGAAVIKILTETAYDDSMAVAFHTGTSAAETMRIDSNQRVGIGTASPSYKLDVNGTARFQGSVRFPDSIGATFGDSGDLQIFHNGSYGNITNGTGNLYIDNTTDNADMYFRVDDAGTLFTAMRIDGSEIGNVHLPNDGQNLYIGENNDIRLVHLSGSNYIYTYNGPLYVGAVSTDQDVFIRGQDGAASINAVQFDMSDAGTAIFNHDIVLPDLGELQFGASKDGRLYSYNNDLYIDNQTLNQDIHLRVNDGGVYTTALFIDGDTSRVGIGTTSPSVKLHINDNNVLIGNNSSGYATLNFHSATTGSARYASIMKNYDSPFDMRIRASNSTAEAPLVFDGDSNTEYARFDTSGNFGIGTTDPSSLDATGNRLVIGGGSGDEGLTIFSGTTGRGTMLFADGNDGSNAEYRGWIQYEHTNDSLEFATASAEKMRIDSSGNVGIGTTNLGTNYKMIVKRATNCNLGVGLQGGELSLEAFNDAITASVPFRLYGSEFNMEGGNVGIGTTSPGNKLDVNGGITTNYGVAFTNGNTNFLQYNNTGDNVLYLRDTTNAQMLQTWSTTSTTIHKPLYVTGDVRTADGTAASPAFRFTSDTNTGIYRKSEDYMAFVASGYERFAANGNGLDLSAGTVNKIVHTAVGSRDKYRVWNSSFYAIGMDDAMTFGGLNDYAMTFQMNDDHDRGFWWGHSSHSDAQGAMSLNTDGKLSVAHSIRVGYGESDTTAPGATYRLDVSGSIGATADVVAYISSDKRLKDNIQNIANPLDKLNKLNGVEFDWNDKQDLYKGHDIGVIAQEVEEVLPEIVDTREDGHKAVKYDRMVALLIEAVKEQQKQINKLEEKLNG